MFTGTFKNDECIFLLKDLTGVIKEVSLEEKEKRIAQGVNYSEMISKEERISDEVNSIFISEMQRNAAILAQYIETLALRIYSIAQERTIIVSLARAGSPIGALLKRFYALNGVNIPHYSISIIRGKGIDEAALNYIREKHPSGRITFVDGWTGKGSITTELRKSILSYNERYHTNISYDLAVVADPARLSRLAATQEDICIPNACLNSTVSGLISRTICNDMYKEANEFHGAIMFKDLQDQDMTNYFLDEISKYFHTVRLNDCRNIPNCDIYNLTESCYVPSVIEKLSKDYPMADINKVKLSIGESSRALIRRKPIVLLVNPNCVTGLSFVKHLATLKNVPIVNYDTMGYNSIALLQ